MANSFAGVSAYAESSATDIVDGLWSCLTVITNNEIINMGSMAFSSDYVIMLCVKVAVDYRQFHRYCKCNTNRTTDPSTQLSSFQPASTIFLNNDEEKPMVYSLWVMLQVRVERIDDQDARYHIWMNRGALCHYRSFASATIALRRPRSLVNISSIHHSGT
jgi:hypothetical protein